MRNSDTVQSRADGAQSARNDGAFKCTHYPGHQGSGYQHRSDAWVSKKGRTNQQSPYPSPEGAPLAPVLHSAAGDVVADGVLLCVVILGDDGDFLCVKAGFPE